MQFDGANVFAIEKDLAALNVIEAEEQGNQRGLAGSRVAHNSEGLAGLDPERDVAKNPVFVGGLRNAAVAEPDVAKLDFAAWLDEGGRVRVRLNGDRLV